MKSSNLYDAKSAHEGTTPPLAGRGVFVVQLQVQ